MVAKRVPVALYVGLAVVVLAIITWLVLRSGSTPGPWEWNESPNPSSSSDDASGPSSLIRHSGCQPGR